DEGRFRPGEPFPLPVLRGDLQRRLDRDVAKRLRRELVVDARGEVRPGGEGHELQPRDRLRLRLTLSDDANLFDLATHLAKAEPVRERERAVVFDGRPCSRKTEPFD